MTNNLQHDQYSPKRVGQAARLDRTASQRPRGSRGQGETIADARARELRKSKDHSQNSPEAIVSSAISGLRQRLHDAMYSSNTVDPAKTKRKIEQVRILIIQYGDNPIQKAAFFKELEALEKR